MAAQPAAMSVGGAGRMRADARRNRERLLDAACDVLVERGADAPLDEIARRAGVGIATLYRRFPDRAALLRQVALELLRRSADEARRALAEEPDAFQALARYMHRALDLRIAAVMPTLAARIAPDAELAAARAASIEQLERIIAAARGAGLLRPDVAPGDVGLLIVRLSRPLPGPFPVTVNRGLAHRHLDLVLDGLRANPGASLGGPALGFQDLAALADAAAPPGRAEAAPQPGARPPG